MVDEVDVAQSLEDQIKLEECEELFDVDFISFFSINLVEGNGQSGQFVSGERKGRLKSGEPDSDLLWSQESLELDIIVQEAPRILHKPQVLSEIQSVVVVDF